MVEENLYTSVMFDTVSALPFLCIDAWKNIYKESILLHFWSNIVGTFHYIDYIRYSLGAML